MTVSPGGSDLPQDRIHVKQIVLCWCSTQCSGRNAGRGTGWGRGRKGDRVRGDKEESLALSPGAWGVGVRGGGWVSAEGAGMAGSPIKKKKKTPNTALLGSTAPFNDAELLFPHLKSRGEDTCLA